VKILVTGGTGFIGSHLVERLLPLGYDVVLLKRSPSNTKRIKHILNIVKTYDLDKSNLKDVIENEAVDLIIHMATCYGKKGESIDKIVGTNITFPSILINLALKNGLKGFINTATSTTEAYSFYASTKKAFLSCLNYFHNENDLKIMNLQLEYVYGPEDDDSKFIPCLIKSILGSYPINASPGMQKRDFIFVDDVVDAFVKSIAFIEKMPEHYVNIGIGTGDSISFRDFVSVLERITSKKALINWGALDYRKNEIFDLKADIKRADELLGWYPEYTLEEGLKKTIIQNGK